jgi:hypothetical protein
VAFKRRAAVSRVGNAWHQGFAHLLSQRAPQSFTLHSEVELHQRPSRVDLEIRRRPDMEARDHEARVLRGLWPRLSRAALLEFKSPTRGFRRGDLVRLVAYGSLYLAQHMNELHKLDDLDLVLVVPAMNKALLAELAFLQCERRSLDPGYAALVGLGYTTYMVVTDEVAETERDEFLKIFSHHPVHDPDAFDWLQDWLALQEEHMPQVKRSKSFHEVQQKLLSSMTPKERLAGLSAKEVLAQFSPDEVLAQFSPDEVLAQFSPDEIRAYLESRSTKK